MKIRYFYGLGLALITIFVIGNVLLEENEVVFTSLNYFETDQFEGLRFSRDELSQLQFYYENEAGEHYASIDDLKSQLFDGGMNLLFAMNGGIFNPDHEPLGLYVERGELLFPLNLEEGEGNFFLKPNGVFLIDGAEVEIKKSDDYNSSNLPDFGLQSGPMLLVEGELHPAFNPTSENRFVRNGVGVTATGEVVFVISKAPVTFYELASFFRDELGVQNALYLDGFISEMFVEGIREHGFSQSFSTMIGVVEVQ